MSQPESSTITDRRLRLGEKLIEISEAMLQEFDETDANGEGDPTRGLALALLLRSVNNYHAARVLLENGIVVEARTIVRCIYENLFWIGGLTGDADEFIEKVIGADAASRLARGKALLAWSENQDALNFDVQALEKTLADLKQHPKQPNIIFEQAAKAGNIGDGYILYRELSSDSAHPSTASLSRHISHDDETGATTYHGEPQLVDGEMDDTVELAVTALLGVCVGTNALLGHTVAGQKLNDVFDQWVKIAKDKKKPIETAADTQVG